MTGFLIKRGNLVTETAVPRRKMTWRHTERRWPCDWSEALTAKNTQDCQPPPEAGGGKEGAVRGSIALLTPWSRTSSLQKWKAIHFCFFKPLTLLDFVIAALGNINLPFYFGFLQGPGKMREGKGEESYLSRWPVLPEFSCFRGLCLGRHSNTGCFVGGSCSPGSPLPPLPLGSSPS